MTNQMKNLIRLAQSLYFVSALYMAIVFSVNGLNFISVFEYCFTGFSLCMGFICVYVRKQIAIEDNKFLEKVFWAKKLYELREEAKLAFYYRHGITPIYNKDGTLLEPDILLGMLTELDENGMLLQSIYEMLGIEPKFDRNGREIPTIFALKNRVRFFSNGKNKLAKKKFLNKLSIHLLSLAQIKAVLERQKLSKAKASAKAKAKAKAKEKAKNKAKSSIKKKSASVKKFVSTKPDFFNYKYKAKKVKAKVKVLTIFKPFSKVYIPESLRTPRVKKRTEYTDTQNRYQNTNNEVDMHPHVNKKVNLVNPSQKHKGSANEADSKSAFSQVINEWGWE